MPPILLIFHHFQGENGSGGRDINLAVKPHDFIRFFATDRSVDSACASVGATMWSRVQ